eukprot:420130-Amorphochlora_amoeboformis.AAC.2
MHEEALWQHSEPDPHGIEFVNVVDLVKAVTLEAFIPGDVERQLSVNDDERLILVVVTHRVQCLGAVDVQPANVICGFVVLLGRGRQEVECCDGFQLARGVRVGPHDVE